MKLPISWLKDYMNLSVPINEFCDGMTMSGSKVEGYEELGKDIQNVVVGVVKDVKKHENSDHLVICQIDVGQEVLQIVTGAPNVFVGAIVPVALHGALLPGGIKIKKTKMRGEESHGMLCSHDELGLSLSDVPGACEDGIICFPDELNLVPGTDIKEVLGLSETVVEFEITPNRPDCLCINGLAREAAATFDVEFNMPKVSVKGCGGDVNTYAQVTVDAPELCPRYAARVVKNIKIGPSPKWMQDRIRAAGMRPINNIVDITNYVLLEYGQPMHAFDIDYLSDHKIIVRCARDGETIKTLDEQDRTLSSDMLVISDPEKAVAVAGVMGGFQSEITDKTTTILFESANFFGPSVRRTAQRLGLRTEASARYEKGLDPNNVIPAVNRACQLVEELGCGEVVDGIIDINNASDNSKVLPFDPSWICDFLGMDISPAFMASALTKLDFKIEGDKVYVPSYRADVEGRADLAEEVVRMYGYDKIPGTLPKSGIAGAVRTPSQKLEYKICDTLCALSYNQIMTYSFTDPKLLSAVGENAEGAIKIMNPLGVENSVMRTNILSSLLEILATNYNHRNETARLFEVGTIYLPKALPLTELPTEKKVITLGGYGKMDFFDIKGTVETLFDTLGVSDYEFSAETNEQSFHPGICARIYINNEACGIIGQTHPDVAEKFGIEEDVYMAEIDFNAVMDASDTARKYKKITRLPAVTRDLAILVDKAVPVAALEKIIKKQSGKLLESVTLFDIYEGKQIPEGKKSVAYKTVFRSAEKTLTDEDVNKIFNKVLKALESELSAQLR